MTQPVDAVLIGAGERGALSYAPYALANPQELRFVAVAEPIPERRERFAQVHQISPDRVYSDWRSLLEQPRLAQAALICTQDQEHAAPALAALRLGYDVLLEKPMATTAEECRLLVETARQTGRQLHVAHVLRYTRHFQKMRQVLQSGVLGQVVHVSHSENVSWWHMAHSYVRGNWANQAESSPIILAKTCHDFDILVWLFGRCQKLSSVGSLLHFRPENAPPGAPPYCLDGCPVAEECPFYAPFIYLGVRPLMRSFAASASQPLRGLVQTHLKAPWLTRAASRVIPPLRRMADYRELPLTAVAHDPTPENVMEALRRGPYGRCVYLCDNDNPDHQVVMMEFSGGISVTLTLHGHSHIEGRRMSIFGSHGSLEAHFGLGGSRIEVSEHRSGRRTVYDTSALTDGGHGGGDFALMEAFIRALRTNGEMALTLAEQALESHLMAFAAEEARRQRTVLGRSAFQAG
jgi:predicted dehydrogenase